MPCQWPTETRVPESLRQYVERWWWWLHAGLGEGRKRLVSRQGGVDRTWHHVLMHLDLARPP
jgi:hypothetical protein